MNCRKVRRLLALLAGGDLGERLAKKVEGHLDSCPGCRQELEEMKTALARVRDAARGGELGWEEKEWRDIVTNASAQQVERRPAPFGLRLRPAWALGFLLLMALVLGIIFTLRVARRNAPLLAKEETSILTVPAPPRELEQKEAPGGSRSDRPFETVRKSDRKRPDESVVLASLGREKTTQDVLSMTLVSQETGLKVHWTFNRNFEWEEKKK